MKLRLATMLLALSVAAVATGAPSARLTLPDLTTLEEQASEVIDVTLDQQLLGMASRFLDPKNPDERNAKEIVSGLQGVYVRSLEFDEPYSLSKADVESIRRQLRAPGWNRIVGVRSRKERSDVEVYILVSGEKALGLAVLAVEPRQFTIVNIVGNIDLEKLHRIEGQLGVPRLELEKHTADKKAATKL
jgi:hypothetical protein